MSAESAHARIVLMRSRLQILTPSRLEIIDESEAHRGHPGAAGGAGHFRILMVSERFSGLARIARHRLVYDCLSDLMMADIHALSLDLRSAQEMTR